MGLYVIQWLDRPGGLETRMATRQAHLDWITAFGDRVKLGGPFLDGEGAMAGSLLLVEADSLEDAEAMADADPYCAAGLYETRQVRPWRATLGAAKAALG